MKKIVRVTVLAVLVGLLFIAGCKAQPDMPDVEGEARDAVLAYSEPATDNLLQGISQNDYATFSRDLDATMAAQMDASAFAKLVEQLGAQLGGYQSREVRAVKSYQNYIIVDYNAKFEQKNVVMRVTFQAEGDHKVTGLFFY